MSGGLQHPTKTAMPRYFAKQVHATFLLAAKQLPRYRFPALVLNSLVNALTKSKAGKNLKTTGDAKPTKHLNSQEAERLVRYPADNNWTSN